MWEYEFKIKLETFDFLLDKINQVAPQTPRLIIKEDYYYGHNQKALFRLRISNEGDHSKFIVTAKDRQVIDKTEMNQEIEFEIDNKESFENFCSLLGFTKIIHKKKKTLLFQFEQWNLELNEIQNLGLFFEAERLSTQSLSSEQWAEEKKQLLNLLNLTEASFEDRPYIQLLGESTIYNTQKESVNQIEIYSDGGCRPNPGVGAWAYILLDGEEVSQSGGELSTTNNRMELQGAIAALEACYERNGQEIPITFYIDSQYVKNGITQWITQWKRKNWKSSTKEAVKNIDLWQKLDELSQKLKINWQWVKGHQGNHYNEICDQLCTEKIQELKNLHS